MSPNSKGPAAVTHKFIGAKPKFWHSAPPDDSSDSSTLSISPPQPPFLGVSQPHIPVQPAPDNRPHRDDPHPDEPVDTDHQTSPPHGNQSLGEPAGSLPSAISAVRSIKQSGSSPLFFLDYDGTLAPIVDDPEKAFLPESTRATLQRLVHSAPIAIVSGRARAKVERFVGLPSGPRPAADQDHSATAPSSNNSSGCLYYAGSHGFDIGGSSGGVCRHMTVAESYLNSLRDARAQIESSLGITSKGGFGTGKFAGATVEDNWLAFSVHFRRCPNRDQVEPLIENVVDSVLDTMPTLKKTFGKCVFEVRPRIDWDKGRAVEWLMEALKTKDGLDETEFTPIYIGDDKTDEDAFRTLKNGRGVSILVQDPEVDPNVLTQAQYILKDPAEVQEFLAQFV